MGKKATIKKVFVGPTRYDEDVSQVSVTLDIDGKTEYLNITTCGFRSEKHEAAMNSQLGNLVRAFVGQEIEVDESEYEGKKQYAPSRVDA